MKIPKLSVITVTYNAEKLLPLTIKSVATQSYANIEFIIIDGGSTDNTLKIIKRYEKYISQWISEPDKGLYDAMNKGLARATGDYVQFLNAGDTYSYPQVLEELFKKCNNADFIYGYTLRVNEARDEFRGWHKKTPPPEKLRAESFMNGMVICHQAMLVKRNIAPEYDLSWKIVADIDWSIKVLKRAQTKCLFDSVLIYFLMGGVSAQRRSEALKERWRVSKKHFGFFPTLKQHVKIFYNYFQKYRWQAFSHVLKNKIQET